MRINELSRYTPVRQTEQPADYKAGQNKIASGAAASADPAAPQDIVVISAENKQESIKNHAAKIEMDEMNRLLGNAKAQADAESESADVQRKCFIIAARIIAGDEVPQKDHRYLAKNNLGLYCKAICMRIVRKKAKRHKPISDDESNHPNSGANAFGNKDIKLPDPGEMLDLPIADTSSGQTAPAVQPDETV